MHLAALAAFALMAPLAAAQVTSCYRESCSESFFLFHKKSLCFLRPSLYSLLLPQQPPLPRCRPAAALAASVGWSAHTVGQLVIGAVVVLRAQHVADQQRVARQKSANDWLATDASML